MLGHLLRGEAVIAPEPEGADVVVVNTCGFIEAAKQESIDVILEMARHRTEGRVGKLVVTGCLVQRYANALAHEIPEVDHYLGNGAYEDVARIVGLDAKTETDRSSITPPKVEVREPVFLHQATTPRANSFLPHSAYVKVSEGCDQKCTFCIIPRLRGTQRSRPIADLVREAQTLAARGVVELNLIAQDLTGYGYDLPERAELADLVRALDRIHGIQWIRLHYAYPRHFSKKLLRVLGEAERLVPYLDMPLQHIADPVLKRMRRGKPRAFIQRLLNEIRTARPDIWLRTSFIVGFPGETDRNFEELLTYVKEEDFSHVGVFRYSREEDTPSFDMEDQVPEDVIEARHATLCSLLKAMSAARLRPFVGQKLTVLVDGPAPESELLLSGRHAGQAPEVDGTIYINDGTARAGDLVEVEITETFDYDLVGHITRIIAPAPPRPDHARLDAPVVAPLSAGRKMLRVVS